MLIIRQTFVMDAESPDRSSRTQSSRPNINFGFLGY